jgi:hypothetical protein
LKWGSRRTGAAPEASPAPTLCCEGQVGPSSCHCDGADDMTLIDCLPGLCWRRLKQRRQEGSAVRAPAAPGAAPAGPALLVMAAILYVSSAAGQRTSQPGRKSSLHSKRKKDVVSFIFHCWYVSSAAGQSTSHPCRRSSLHNTTSSAI